MKYMHSRSNNDSWYPLHNVLCSTDRLRLSDIFLTLFHISFCFDLENTSRTEIEIVGLDC